MVGVPRLVPTPMALSCAAMEVDSRKGLAVMVWHCYWVCEMVEEQSRIQQVIDDVANHLNMGENISYSQK